jgi:hypothetical protein
MKQGLNDEVNPKGLNGCPIGQQPFNLYEGAERLKPLKNHFNPFNHNEIVVKRREILENLRGKQPFRVAIGKGVWVDYEHFNQAFNLREILNNEIVIEFDSEDQNLTWKGVNFTAINLLNAGYSFEIWDHEGRSPHLHIHNLPLKDLPKDKRALFKKLFIRKYVPKNYLSYVDTSLAGTHLIAIEWANHWKGKYNVKRLLHKFEPQPLKQPCDFDAEKPLELDSEDSQQEARELKKMQKERQ